MIGRLLLGVFAAVCLVAAASAQMTPGIGLMVPVSVSSATGCTKASTYITALPDAPSVTETAAFNSIICALDAAGFFCSTGDGCIDGLHILANASDANAKVNVVAPGTRNLTEHGTCTFTIDRGITGNLMDCYEDANVNLSTAGLNYALLSSTAGFCILNNRTTFSGTPVGYGSADGTNFTFLGAHFSGSGTVVSMSSVGGLFIPSTTSQGTRIQTRQGVGAPTGSIVYENGVAAAVNQFTSALPNSGLFFLALSTSGTPSDFSADQFAWLMYGGGFTAAQAASFRSIMNTGMAILGVPSVCFFVVVPAYRRRV